MLHLLLVVRLGALSLDILLDAVNCGLVRDQTLLNFVQSVVNLVLKDHVTTSVMLHGMVGRLLSKPGPIGAHLLPNGFQAMLLSLMVGLELFRAGKLVRHFIFHFVDVIGIHLHFLVHTTFKISDFLKIGPSSLYFDLQRCGSALSFVQLTLLEVEILLHLFDLIDTWQGCRAVKVLVHVLEERSNGLLSVGHLGLEPLLLGLILLCKLVDLLLF